MSAERNRDSLAESGISAGSRLPHPWRNRCPAKHSLLAVQASMTIQPPRPSGVRFGLVWTSRGSGSDSDRFQYRVAVRDPTLPVTP